VLAGGAAISSFPVASVASKVDELGLIHEDAVGNDFCIEAAARISRQRIRRFCGLPAMSDVGLGGEGFEMLAGEFGVRDGEELLFDFGLGGEVGVAEDGGCGGGVCAGMGR